MVAAIASYYGTNGADADPGAIKSRVRQAIVDAPRGGRTDHEIDGYLGDRHLNDIVGWARSRERTKLPRPKQTFRNLAAIAEAVPVGGERTTSVRAIAAALIRCDSIPTRLTLALEQSWSDQHCSPPLPGTEVRRIVNDLARREATRLGGNDGR
jgi:hypothetical protein